MQRVYALLCALLTLTVSSGSAQQAISLLPVLQGLRSVDHHGSFPAAAFLADGSAVLVFDAADGVRLVQTDPTLHAVTREAHIGTAGDRGVALRVDSQGNVFVGGTSSSGQLPGTPGTAFTFAADNSLNSFVARFDSNLHLVWLSFLGGGRTQLTGLAVEGSSVFVTGSTYNDALPTTPGALASAPANGSFGNGFVQSFTAAGGSLVYSTYLTAPQGAITPVGIAADASGTTYIAGSTSSPEFPVHNPLETSLWGPVSGFVAGLAPAGNALTFATYIPGGGLTGVALDSSGAALLLSGSIDNMHFPLANATAPLAALPAQSLLRLSTDGQTLQDSVLLFPGTGSQVTAGNGGSAWVTGQLSAPVSTVEQAAGVGQAYALHLSSADIVDAVFRSGPYPRNHIQSRARPCSPLQLPRARMERRFCCPERLACKPTRTTSPARCSAIPATPTQTACCPAQPLPCCPLPALRVSPAPGAPARSRCCRCSPAPY